MRENELKYGKTLSFRILESIVNCEFKQNTVL